MRTHSSVGRVMIAPLLPLGLSELMIFPSPIYMPICPAEGLVCVALVTTIMPTLSLVASNAVHHLA